MPAGTLTPDSSRNRFAAKSCLLGGVATRRELLVSCIEAVMNTNRTLQSLALLTAILLSIAVGNASKAAPEPIRVFIVDDQTGEELLRAHGISPIVTEDLIELINAGIMGGTPVQIYHLPVDEDATDNTLSQLRFEPFVEEVPTLPSGSIPVHQFPVIKRAYDEKRHGWQTRIVAYQREVVENAKVFIQRVGNTQVEVAQRFDRQLKARGSDFNRSDIVGCIETANRILGTSGRRILILNTDAVDLPGKRKPRSTPLNRTELDTGIELIFVNTSRVPEQSILFAGIPNPVGHAESVKEAMRQIVSMIGTTEQ